MTSLIKEIWFYFIDILFRIKLFKAIKTNLPYTIFDSGKKQTFFGYHDITPFNKKGDKILAMAGDMENKPLKTAQKIDIGYFNIDKPMEFIKLGETTTWCWQQGARLRWFPGQDDLVIYNKLVDGKYGAVIQNINTKEIVKQLNYPIYDISCDGKFAASLNFSRLGKLRPGYGYINLPEDINKEDSEDGIWIHDIEKNTKELIISLEALFKMEQSNDKPENHYINHLSFNPSGDRLLFFYLQSHEKKRKIKVFVSNIDGTNIVTINNGRKCSHFDWRNKTELLMYSETEFGFRYLLHNTLDGESNQLKPTLLKLDSHPYFIDEDKFITDSYPIGLSNRQSLYLYNLKGHLTKIAQFYSPINYCGENRCDLHSRISYNNEMVSIDVPFPSGRKMIILKDFKKCNHDT